MVADSGIDSLPYDKRWGHYRMRLISSDLKTHRDMLLELIRRAAGTPAPMDE